MSSWACSKCTYLNSPSQTFSCKICLSPVSSTSTSTFSPHRWSCAACTFSNPNATNRCEMCGTMGPSSDLCLEPDEIDDPSIGSVFLPLRRCSTKRAAEAERPPAEAERGGVEEKRRKKEKEVEEVAVPSEVSGHSDSGSTHTVLKVLSYNVWFREDLELHKRMEALGDLILQHLPDVICFQEVTPDIYEIFQNSDWWGMYKCSLTKEMAITRPYFCMQMSKLPVRAFTRKPFDNSCMGRELCMAEVDVGMDKKLVVGTSHLESPSPGLPNGIRCSARNVLLRQRSPSESSKTSPT